MKNGVIVIKTRTIKVSARVSNRHDRHNRNDRPILLAHSFACRRSRVVGERYQNKHERFVMSTKTSTYLGCDRSDAMKEERETPPRFPRPHPAISHAAASPQRATMHVLRFLRLLIPIRVTVYVVGALGLVE